MRSLSLRQRLVLAGIAVALLAVVVTAYSVQRLTESTIRSALALDLDLERDIRDQLAFHGAVNGDWDDVAAEVENLALATGERIAVASLDGMILADSAILLDEGDEPLPAQATIVDPASEFFDFQISDEDLAQIDEFNDVFLQCLDEAGIPAFLNEEDFGFIEPAVEITEAEEAELFDCVTETFGGDEFLADLDELGVPVEEAVAEVAPPLQLFIGYGDDREGLFASDRSGAFWLAVLGVLAAAIAVTVLIADRIARPIGSMTIAARAMSKGDLTARVDVEGADEIARLGQAFNDMADSIEAEDRARRTLTTDVAHELRSPLANLRGYLEAIQDGVVQPDEATISSLHEEATVLQVLVDDLQQLSLAEAGQLTLNRVPIDLGDLVERTVAAHLPSATAVGVELKAITDPGLIVAVDGDRIRQILTNLIVNGIRHTPAGGLVAVVLAPGDPVAIEVRDSGDGIEAEHLPHLFDRFYRADRSRARATGGSGLGLAIAQELARAHSGRLEVESVVGEGSTFRLLLPRS